MEQDFVVYFSAENCMFEDVSNKINHCDNLTGESNHGFKPHNNSESFQLQVAVKKNYARV